MSPFCRFSSFAVGGVKRLMCNSVSRKTVATSLLVSMLVMSLLARSSSSSFS